MKVEIIFRNKTTKISKAEVIINGNKFIFKGKEAKELARLANRDTPGIKNCSYLWAVKKYRKEK